MSQVLLLDGHGTLTYPLQDRCTIYQQICQQYKKVVSREYLQQLITEMREKHFTFLMETMEKYGTIAWEEDKKIWFSLEKSIFQKLGIEADYYQLSWDLLANFMNPQQQQLYPDVLPFLHKAKRNGIRLGILSNSDSRYKNILHHFSIDHFFEHILLSSEVKYKKPGRQIFDKAVTLFKEKPNNLSYIGDQEHLDVIAAYNAGYTKNYLLKRNSPPIPSQGIFIQSLQEVFTYL